MDLPHVKFQIIMLSKFNRRKDKIISYGKRNEQYLKKQMESLEIKKIGQVKLRG